MKIIIIQLPIDSWKNLVLWMDKLETFDILKNYSWKINFRLSSKLIPENFPPGFMFVFRNGVYIFLEIISAIYSKPYTKY